ncbi:MAG: alpha/beta fold hydrolase [Croceibacterium sp.]
MSKYKSVFVLVHGGWHNQSAWGQIKPILETGGAMVLALDLPGAGVNTIEPKSLEIRPFDLTAFATEPSSVASVTQEQRTQAVIVAVKEAASRSDHVILVGHSAGGMTISAVAEQVPDLLAAVVYIAGFMVPNGMSLFAMLSHGSMSSALSPGLFVGDPVGIGATRINPGPSDEPNGGALAPSQIHGRQIRHRPSPLYPDHARLRCPLDRAGSHDCSD